jgi:hypothetical protein
VFNQSIPAVFQDLATEKAKFDHMHHRQGLIDSLGEEGMQLPFIITFLSESERFFYK